VRCAIGSGVAREASGWESPASGICPICVVSIRRKCELSSLEHILWRRLLGRLVAHEAAASGYGMLCHGDGGHEWGERCRRALMLTIPA